MMHEAKLSPFDAVVLLSAIVQGGAIERVLQSIQRRRGRQSA